MQAFGVLPTASFFGVVAPGDLNKFDDTHRGYNSISHSFTGFFIQLFDLQPVILDPSDGLSSFLSVLPGESCVLFVKSDV